MVSLLPHVSSVRSQAWLLKVCASPQNESFLDMLPSCSMTCGSCTSRSSRSKVEALPVLEALRATFPTTSVAAEARWKPVPTAATSVSRSMPLPSRGRMPWLAREFRAGHGARTSPSLGGSHGWVASLSAVPFCAKAGEARREVAATRQRDLNEGMVSGRKIFKECGWN